MVVYTLEQRFAKWACHRLTENVDFGKKKKNHLFSWCSFWSWRVCKQSKLLHLEHRKPACIHWKAGAPQTNHSLLRILVQNCNWAIFLQKWAKSGRYSQWWSLAGHVERILVHKNWRGRYWQHLVSKTYHRADLHPIFEDRSAFQFHQFQSYINQSRLWRD